MPRIFTSSSKNFDKSNLSHLILRNKVQELQPETTPFGDFKQGRWGISKCTSTQRECPRQKKFSYKSFRRPFIGHRLSYDRYQWRSRRVQGASRQLSEQLCKPVPKHVSFSFLNFNPPPPPPKMLHLICYFSICSQSTFFMQQRARTRLSLHLHSARAWIPFLWRV